MNNLSQGDYHKLYYQANKERIKERQKAYYYANRESIRKRQQGYRQANKQRAKMQQKSLRTCLRCGQEFLSFGIQNRICPLCKRVNRQFDVI